MSNLSTSFKARIKKSMERERSLEQQIETFSRVLWPYPESRLILLVIVMPAFDVASTFAALELSGKEVFEAGLIGKWSLHNFGFFGQYIIETTCVGLLVLAALGAKRIYMKLGFKGFSRAACVLLLLPTFVAITAAVLNNVILTLI